MFKQISKHVYVLEDISYRGYPYLGYVISDDNKPFLIDAGFSKKQKDILYQELDKANLPYPVAGTITHSHYDHSFGMAHYDIPFYVNNRTQEELVRLSKLDWHSTKGLNKIIENNDLPFFAVNAIYGEYHDDLSQIKIKTDNIIYNKIIDEFRVELGKDDIVHIFLINQNNSNHSRDTTIVYILEDQIIFVGDSCYYDVFDVLHDYTKEQLVDFFTQLLSYETEKVVFGHQEIGTQKDIVKLYQEHLKLLFNEEKIIL